MITIFGKQCQPSEPTIRPLKQWPIDCFFFKFQSFFIFIVLLYWRWEKLNFVYWQSSCKGKVRILAFLSIDFKAFFSPRWSFTQKVLHCRLNIRYNKDSLTMHQPAKPEQRLDATTAARPSTGFWECNDGLFVDWALSVTGWSCTTETPTNNMKRENHWILLMDFFSMTTEKRAVVRIFSW